MNYPMKENFAHWLLTQCPYETQKHVVIALLNKLTEQEVFNAAVNTMFPTKEK